MGIQVNRNVRESPRLPNQVLIRVRRDMRQTRTLGSVAFKANTEGEYLKRQLQVSSLQDLKRLIVMAHNSSPPLRFAL